FVCEKHQNVHLMVDTIYGSNKEKLLLMDKVVCDISNQECMLKRCPRCPDRSMLVQKELRNNDFVEELAKKMDALTSHHLISN
ncbi:Cc8L18.2-like protein, partial [Daphnia magna]